jgi:hypothetical protein
MDYNKMTYEELVEQLKRHLLFMNITKAKEFFEESNEDVCKILSIILEKNKDYYSKHFRED